MDAVLDMKWSTSQPLLAVGDAKGTVSVYSLSQENQLVIRDKTSIKVENSTGSKKFVAEVKSMTIFLRRHYPTNHPQEFFAFNKLAIGLFLLRNTLLCYKCFDSSLI